MSLRSPSNVGVAARQGFQRRARTAPPWPSRLAMALWIVLAAACGGDSTAPASLAITPASPTVRIGGGLQLSVTGADGPVVWTTSDAGVATVAAGRVTGIAAGTTTITATVGHRAADVQLVVTQPPTIVLAATAIGFGSTADGMTPAAQTVSITNGGDEAISDLTAGTITYAGGASDWLTATLDATTAPTTLTLQPSTATLQAGTYTATVPITSATAVNSPQTVIVTYVIGPAPVIALGQSIANFTAQTSGTVTAPQSITITNTGGGTLSGLATGAITYSTGASDWLSANINPSTAPATLTMQPATTDLPVGTYTATVPVASTVPGVTPADVIVTYQVTAAPSPPSIALAASTADFQTTAGGALPASQLLGVANAGGGTLTGLAVAVTYLGGGQSGWLSATLGASTAPTTLTLQPTSVLPAGTYTADVAVSSSDGATTNSPQHVAVTYTVEPPPAIVLSATTATFTATAPSVDPPQQTVDVSNGGGGALTGLSTSIAYTGATTGWLSASVASSAPNAPSHTPLTLDVTTGSIAPGEYHATVTVSSSEAGVAPQAIAVTFTRIATLAGDVQPQVFSPFCSSCHVGVGAPLGVDLSDASHSYASLVGVHAVTDPASVRVVAGDSTNSYLRKQVSQDPSITPGAIMPTGCSDSSCLSASLVHLISMWIQQGAHP